jgi:uncharacterized membrane protein
VEVNIGRMNRIVRGLVGAVLIAVALAFVRNLLGFIIGIIGAVLIFSGVVGFCHVYSFFRVRMARKP